MASSDWPAKVLRGDEVRDAIARKAQLHRKMTEQLLMSREEMKRMQGYGSLTQKTGVTKAAEGWYGDVTHRIERDHERGVYYLTSRLRGHSVRDTIPMTGVMDSERIMEEMKAKHRQRLARPEWRPGAQEAMVNQKPVWAGVDYGYSDIHDRFPDSEKRVLRKRFGPPKGADLRSWLQSETNRALSGVDLR